MSRTEISSCQEHDDAIQVDEPPSCEDCGKLIWTVTCPHCKSDFIDWRVVGQDDVMSAAHYAQDGALLCVDCVGYHDADEMGFDDEGYIPNDYP